MRSGLLDATDAPITFVVGKGGVGKTTTAGALALGHADAGAEVLLVSTDPAHSAADLFGVAGPASDRLCGVALALEEFDARAYADRWTARVATELSALVEAGTYLDAEDTRRFLDLSIPGIDEVMAALRLAAHPAGAARIIVDTAPTGHTLRLLGAGAVIRSWADALDAMADKARTVAEALAARRVRVAGERLVGELRDCAERWEVGVLRHAAAVIVTRAGDVVTAETRRLADALDAFGLRRAAIVCVASDRAGAAALDLPAAARFAVRPGPWTAPGCDALRDWLAAAVPAGGGERAAGSAVRPAPAAADVPAGHGPPAAHNRGPAVPRPHSVGDWLDERAPTLLFFAGKGGVGKTTCAATVALRLAGTRPVLLYSTDPAGSLGEVLGVKVGPEPGSVAARLRARQLDAGAALAALREEYEQEVEALFNRIGSTGDAALDRRVALSIWHMAPPGMDEIAALIGILESGPDETIVVDTAPTGHFLRLLQMPSLALDWTHALMRVLLKYRMAGTLEGLAERVLALARQLRSLQVTLTTPGRTGAFVVTLEEPLVRAETARLAAALEAAGVAHAVTIVNRASGTAPEAAAVRTILAPSVEPAPVGAPRLADFLERWEFAG